MSEQGTQSTGTTKRPAKKALAWGMVVIAVLLVMLAAGYAVRQWQEKILVADDRQNAVFTGGSAHWDQDEIPISMKCGACHEKEFKEWANSDHAWAFRKLGPQWDAEAFQGVSLKAHGSMVTFSTSPQNERKVHDQKTGKSWPAAWATGRTPLVQYLVPAEDGGFHTLSASWDINNKEWFDIFGQESRDDHDWGHWMGRGMNWNSQCAWCHMSDFRKNYDYKTDRYASTWKEPGVTCIQCHGPLLKTPESGTGCMISTTSKMTARQMHDNCASCHARRDELDDDFRAGDLFDDHFFLILPVQPGIFWPNGMQRDEDYCETGLRLSAMGKAGVTCLDCHDPHTGTLKLPQEDNSLCMRCHGTGEKVNNIAAPVIKPDEHSPCPPTSKGARCVECHMPESLYMARDPRRDHSFNSPDPQLSVELKIPNACIMCHKDKDDQWAAREVEKYYGREPKMAKYRERTRAVQRAYDGDSRALEALLKVYAGESNPSWKATILALLDAWADDERVQAIAQSALADKEPMVRGYAVRLLGRTGRIDLSSMLNDPVKLVRLEAAWVMKGTLKPGTRAFNELVRSSLYRADQPSGVMRMAQIESDHGNLEAAEQWYQKALKWDSSSAVVYRDYAVFLASHGKTEQAFDNMKKAAGLAPQDPGMWYLLGLGAVEAGKVQEALDAFSQAVKLDGNFYRAYYNRALLYHSEGRADEAIADLQYCADKDTANAEYPYTIGIIYIQAGEKRKAYLAAAEALRRNPSHASARILLQQASQ